MKKLLPLIILTMFSTTSFAATAVLAKDGKKVSYEITSKALTPSGLKIHIENGTECLISSDFLKSNNTSGFDLLKSLAANASLVIECDGDSDVHFTNVNTISY